MPPSSVPPRFLNLGCGAAFDPAPEWLNMDIAVPRPAAGSVRSYPLTLGIPLGDNVFEGVYHSHLLEHFSRGMALPFLRECLRVLRPGGVLRVVVPDVEPILRLYLEAMDQARRGVPGASDRLTWMQVELFDQMTRRVSGGHMAAAWQSANEDCATFIRSRLGGELEILARQPVPGPLTLPEEPLRLPVTDARFLDGGEAHQWMYDEISLASLLEQAGFAKVRRVGHAESALPGFRLDSDARGGPRKPDSLYMEAHKPGAATAAPAAAPSAALFCTTDTGGAAIAALRLHEGLRNRGLPSIAYVQHKAGTGSQVYVAPPGDADHIIPDGRGGALLASRPAEWKKQALALAAWPDRPQDCEMFSTSEASARLADIPLLDHTDILHFHWIAGFVDIAAEADWLAGKKIVWTLHDMNPFTGGCHYAGNCRGYLERCGTCPQLGSSEAADLSRRTWKRKDYAYRRLDITVVAPSRWLAEEARHSSLLGRFPVHCIPYGLPLGLFKPYDKAAARALLGIPRDSRPLMFSADSVLNRRKGLVHLLEALRRFRRDPASRGALLLLAGGGGEQVRALDYPVKVLGRVADPHIMAAAYSAAEALILPTQEDNLPNVLLEALACGTPAVAFEVGGVPDILDHGQTGWLARPRDPDSLVEGLRWALAESTPRRGTLCRARTLERYSLELQARRYAALYDDIRDIQSSAQSRV